MKTGHLRRISAARLPQHTRRTPHAVSAAAVALSWLISASVMGDAPDRGSSGSPRDDGVARLIAALGDPSYQTRIEATRQLCAVGPGATEALRRAAEGDAPEVALRAKQLLHAFENLLFSGVDLNVRFSKPRVAWDEPVDLIVTMTNRAAHASRLPLESPRSNGDKILSTADQVAVMLDLADWLVVRRPDNGQTDLHVDDMLADGQVARVVAKRVNDPPVSLLPPGASRTIVLKDFNRGWARYRLLDAGRYAVEIDYAPAWDDPLLVAQRVGAAKSNTAVIEVAPPAPPAVSRRGRELSLTLTSDGRTLTARMTNQMDRNVQINTNLGQSMPFATAEWVAIASQEVSRISAALKMPSSWHDFDAALLVEVAPGESTVIATADWADLRRRFADTGVDLAQAKWSVQLVYSNLTDHKWQWRQAKMWTDADQIPPDVRRRFPLWIPVTTQTSNEIKMPPIAPPPLPRGD